jgi:hypothetical protein
MSVIYVFLAVTAVMSLLQIAVFMWEKRLTWPYGAIQSAPPHGDPSGYGQRMQLAALQCGFMMLGWTPDNKGEKYQMNYGFMVSPDGQSLLIIGMGNIFGIELRGVTIHSPSDDGLQSRYTADNQAAIESDVLRQWMSQLVFNRDFAGIWQAHQNWMATARFSRHTFNPSCAMAEFRRIREQRFDEMIRRNYIAYTDASQTFWRYTFTGALKVVFLNYGTGLVRAVTFGRFPKTA